MFTSSGTRTKRKHPSKRDSRTSLLSNEGEESSVKFKHQSQSLLPSSPSYSGHRPRQNSLAASRNNEWSPFQPSPPHKKQAIEIDHPTWASPFSKQIPKQTVETNTIQENTEEPVIINEGEEREEGAVFDDADDAVARSVEQTLLRGDKHAVFAVSTFPESVRKQLGSVELKSMPVKSGINEQYQFAYVATSTTCFVWSYADGSKNPNTYQLAMPDPRNAYDYETPVIALISADDTQRGDIGVLACSSAGQIRYWDRVVLGLGGVDRFCSKTVPLPDTNDKCSEITEVYSGLYILATKKGYLFQVSLQNDQGSSELAVRLLSKSTGSRSGMLSRVSSLLGTVGGGSQGSAAVGPRDSLVGLAIGGRTEIRHSREVIALTKERLIKWVVSRSHPEKFMFSMDLSDVLCYHSSKIYKGKIGVDVFDVAVSNQGEICLLIGVHLISLGPGEVRLAVVMLKGQQASTEPEVLGMWPLNSFTEVDYFSQYSPSLVPKLALPDGGPGLFVVLPQIVIAATIPTRCVSFEEKVVLHDDDIILGFGSRPKGSQIARHGQALSSESGLMLASLKGGVLRIAVDIGRVLSAPQPTGRRTNGSRFLGEDVSGSAPTITTTATVTVSEIEHKYQVQIEQAIFFGMDNTSNPLSFAIASQEPGTDTSLENAALRVSKSLLDNTSHFVTDRLDLGAHLKEREHQAHSIMQYLANNQLTAKLSQSTRVQLCANAEKLAAVCSLWEYQNDMWAKKGGAASQLLVNLISSFLERVGLQSKDPLRTFFKLHAGAVGDLLVFMDQNLAPLRRALETSGKGINDSQLVGYEANRIAIAVLQSAFSYRFQNADLYQCIDEQDGNGNSNELSGLAENWTEHTGIADLLIDRLESSYQLCRDISGRHCAPVYERIKETVLPNDEGPSQSGQDLSIFDDAVSVSYADLSLDDHLNEDKQLQMGVDDPYISPMALLRELINQIGPLANLCFQALVDRISYLVKANQSVAHELTYRYEAVRSRYLLCLVPLGRTPIAFRLAEEYRDLATLITLVFTTDRDNAAEHLSNLVSRFGREFADTLYVYYERRQAWASLLHSQDEHFDKWLKEYIDSKIESHPHDQVVQVGWIHDVKISDFGAAAAKLARAGRDAEEVSHSRTMLSLSKLAFIAVEGQEAAMSSLDMDTTGQNADDNTMTEAHSRLEDALELCEIQGYLQQYFTALMSQNGEDNLSEWQRSDDSDDRKAVRDLAMLTTSAEIRHGRSSLYIIYNELVRRVWNGWVLSIEDLLDVLTFPDCMEPVTSSDEQDESGREQYNSMVSERYSLAVDILSRVSSNLPEQTRNAALRSIWRRVFVCDNWKDINKRVKGNVPDSVLRSELRNTVLYKVLSSCLNSRGVAYPGWFVSPLEAYSNTDLEYLVTVRLGPQFSETSSTLGTGGKKLKLLTPTTAPDIAKDYAEEDKQLAAAIDSGLGAYYEELLAMATSNSDNSSNSGESMFEMVEKDDRDVPMDTD